MAVFKVERKNFRPSSVGSPLSSFAFTFECSILFYVLLHMLLHSNQHEGEQLLLVEGKFDLLSHRSQARSSYSSYLLIEFRITAVLRNNVAVHIQLCHVDVQLVMQRRCTGPKAGAKRPAATTSFQRKSRREGSASAAPSDAPHGEPPLPSESRWRSGQTAPFHSQKRRSADVRWWSGWVDNHMWIKWGPWCHHCYTPWEIHT